MAVPSSSVVGFPLPWLGVGLTSNLRRGGGNLSWKKRWGTKTEAFLGSGKIYHGAFKGKWGFIKFKN